MDPVMDIAAALAWVRESGRAVGDGAALLTDLDRAIGDGDHGANLTRGFTAVLAALEPGGFATVGQVLTRTGSALISSVGGASGPLYGSAFRAAGRALPSPTADGPGVLAALRVGLEAVRRLGGAEPGDKTMVDAYAPALDALAAALAEGDTLPAAAGRAAEAATAGAAATVPLIARRGRASYLGPRSAGHQDPGATSTALIFQALATALRHP